MKRNALIVVSVLILSIVGWLLFIRFKFNDVVVVVNEKVSSGEVKKVEPIRSVKFELDSITIPESVNYVQLVVAKNGRKKITFLNTEADVIYVYDWNSGELENRVSLDRYGFTHEQKIQGYYFINEDSVLLFSYQYSKLSLVSLQNGLIYAQSLGDQVFASLETVFPYVSGRTPMVYDEKDRTVYLTGFMSDEGGNAEFDKERKVLSKVCLRNAKKNSFLAYPKFYWGINWGGGGGMRQVFFDFNADERMLVISFMASNYLTLVDENGGFIKDVKASSDLVDTISSLPYSAAYFDFIDMWDIYNYYLTSACYTIVKYDPLRHVYYRIAELPMDKDKYYREIKSKRKVVIIMDKDFFKISECLLPDDSDINLSFISDDGVYIKRAGSNENELVFDMFEFTKS